MKRFISSSTLLVGILLTTHVRAATGEAAQDAPPAADGSGQTSTPPSSDQAGTETPTQPSTSTTPASAADTTQQAPAEAPTTPKPRAWAGTAIYLTNSMTTGTVFRGQQQSYNPTAEAAFWLLPRYAINDAFQLRGRLIVNYEYTNSDTTQYRNEPMLSDTTLQLFYRKIPKVLGIQPAIAANVGLPTSKLSRARTMVFAPGASAQLSRAFEHVLGGEVMFITSAIYSHPIYQARNPEVVDPRPAGAFQCVGGAGCQDLLSGVMNPSDTIAYFALLGAEWGRWNPAIYYLGASQWAYTPKEVTANDVVPGAGDQAITSGQQDPTSVRQTHYFSVWLDYNFNTWFTGEIGYWQSRTALGENGKRGNIVYDPYQDTRVYLGASFQLDNLMKVLEGNTEGEAGVVRAQNTKKPMWSM